jgi:hypothetical protein
MYMTSYILVGKYRRFGGYFCLNPLLFNPENTLLTLPNRTALYYIILTTSTAVRNLTLVLKIVLRF